MMDEMDEVYTTEEKLELLRLARDSIKAKLNDCPMPDDTVALTDAMMARRSCFVTLHDKGGALRGCIGNIGAFESLADNVIHNAVNAAFHDPRFLPLRSNKEFEGMVIEISVLTEAKKVDSYRRIRLGEHGIILRRGQSGAVFLPQVAVEQEWDLDTTLTQLSLKAGLPPDSWKLPDTVFEVFSAIVFKEGELG